MLRLKSTTWLAAAAIALAAGGLAAASTSGAVDGVEWRTIGRTFQEQNFSPLDQINAGNAKRLGLAWFVDLGTTRGVEAAPLFADGVLYNISAWNVTSAIDARTGKVLWIYDPKVPPQFARWACCDVVSRGLGLWKDKVIIATLDGRLIALDRKTGKPVWTTQTVDREGPYAVTGAPRVFDGKVLIGSGGADFGARGYVTAYDAESGKQIWRFYIVPGDPSKPDGTVSDKVLAEKAVPTWRGQWWTHGGGGGNAWDAIVYDPELKLIYIGTGNGGPMPQAFRSPGGGDNLFLGSIVAVRADTGEYVWHYQLNPGEQWDYTATQPIILADLKIDGKNRKVLMQAPKNGFFYVIDRTTGKLISAKPYSAVTWAKGIDLKTGRPIENPEARYDNEPRLLAPGPGGAHNWQPMSYDPRTGLVYIPAQEHWGVYPLGAGRPESPPGEATLKERSAKSAEYWKIAEQREHAWLSAWDPIAQREVWRVPHSRPGSGGVLSTAGNLVIQGTPDKTLSVYRADTGELLAALPTENAPVAGPISYMLDGVQYIAINAGWGGGMALVEMSQGKPPLQNGPARLLVFKLDGQAKLPPFTPNPVARVEPPLARAPEAQVRAGADLYNTKCAVCHGKNVRGGIKDLRWISRDTHAHFSDIVLGGQRADKGMPNFKGELDSTQVAAIHAYVVARSNEDFFADTPAGQK
jgi:quinohemoprotein ethanol dehydrogenase